MTPNDPYRGRTAQLTSKFALYIFVLQIQVPNILNMVYTLRFFSSSKCSLFHKSNVFGSCIIHILYTVCAKIEKNNSGAKRLNCFYYIVNFYHFMWNLDLGNPNYIYFSTNFSILSQINFPEKFIIFAFHWAAARWQELRKKYYKAKYLKINCRFKFDVWHGTREEIVECNSTLDWQKKKHSGLPTLLMKAEASGHWVNFCSLYDVTSRNYFQVFQFAVE